MADNKSTQKNKEIENREKRIRKKTSAKIWALKIIIVTFFLTLSFSFLSEVATSKSNLLVAIFIIIFLIVINILFDGIAVAVTYCDVAPLFSMAARKIPGSKAALLLVKNADKVSNICADVIGDICGIISGTCSVVVVAKILDSSPSASKFILTIVISAIVASLTIGGKAFGKSIAMNYSKDYVMAAAKFVSFFKREK